MFDFKRAASAVGRGFSKAFSAYLARRAIMPLLYANERMLRDVGLSRADIVDCLSGSLCADPSRLLIARISGRHEAERGVAADLLPVRRETPANDVKSYAAKRKQSLAA